MGRDHFEKGSSQPLILDFSRSSGQQALHRALTQLWSDHNQDEHGLTHVESEYLEVVAIRI
jgi:hypothetical protein